VPTDGDVKDGKIFYNGDWVAIKEKKVVKDTSKDVPMEIKIGKLVLNGTARPKHFDNSNRNGYTIFLQQGQALFGNGNLYLK